MKSRIRLLVTGAALLAGALLGASCQKAPPNPFPDKDGCVSHLRPEGDAWIQVCAGAVEWQNDTRFTIHFTRVMNPKKVIEDYRFKDPNEYVDFPAIYVYPDFYNVETQEYSQLDLQQFTMVLTGFDTFDLVGDFSGGDFALSVAKEMHQAPKDWRIVVFMPVIDRPPCNNYNFDFCSPKLSLPTNL